MFTSCAVRSSDPHFLDEMKVKLPLTLKPGRKGSTNRTLSLFFSVFHIKFKSRKSMWTAVLPASIRGSKRDSSVSGVNDVDEATGERSEAVEEGDLSGKCKLVLFGCGFLPVTTEGCLVENGLHDVKLVYKGRPPTAEQSSNGGIATSSLILRENSDASMHSLETSGFEPREGDEANVSLRTRSEAEFFGGEESDSGVSEISDQVEVPNTEGEMKFQAKQASAEQMTLQVGNHCWAW
jgi:hypothetical protein